MSHLACSCFHVLKACGSRDDLQRMISPADLRSQLICVVRLEWLLRLEDRGVVACSIATIAGTRLPFRKGKPTLVLGLARV